MVAMTKARSTTTDGSPVPTHDGRSNDGTLLPEFGAGRKACLRAEVPPRLRQNAVVYHRLYDRVFGDQCSASTTLLSRFLPRRSRPGQHQRKPLSRMVVLWCDSGMDKTCSKRGWHQRQYALCLCPLLLSATAQGRFTTGGFCLPVPGGRH